MSHERALYAEPVTDDSAATAPIKPPEPSLALAFRASAVAGAVAGSLLGAVSPVVAALDEFSYWVLVAVPVLAIVGAIVGALLALFPGAGIGVMLQRIDSAPSAPKVGAFAGALVGLALSFLIGVGSDSDTAGRLFGIVAFLLAGAAGGFAGGRVLKKYA